MKTIKLKSGNNAIVVRCEFYLYKSLFAAILSNAMYHNDLSLDGLGKRAALKIARDHLRYQGKTTYSDWYEDTEATPVLNEHYSKAIIYIESKFPELY